MNTKLKRVKNRIVRLAKRNKVRVRFAPSPTGFLHVGGLRTALYNYLFAKKQGGKFILRIEDTDRMRLVPGGMENIMRTLSRVGLKYSEGPVFEGDKIVEEGSYGPYIQSQRLKIYQDHALELVKNGWAYRCFCAPERLDSLRAEQEAAKKPLRYDRLCLTRPKKETEEKLSRGDRFVIRQRMPDTGETEFEDLIHGKIVTKNEVLEDHVLQKADGYPTYNFANVIDDHLMRISHVIRGEEFISSTPKHALLYKAFGWNLPKFVHLPLLLNADRSKLSKRQGDVAVEDYLKKGYLPEALLNFVALLGWNPSGEQEIFTLKELIKSFEIEKVNKSGAIFNLEKLDWLNGMYLRALTPAKLLRVAAPFLINAGLLKKNLRSFIVSETNKSIKNKKLAKLLTLEQERIKHLDELPEAIKNFLTDKLEYDPAILVWKKSTKEIAKERLEKLAEMLGGLSRLSWKEAKLEVIIKKWIEDNKYSNGEVLWPMRVALSGKEASPPPFAIAEVLGSKSTLERIGEAVAKLS